MLRLSVALVFTLTAGLSTAQAATIVDFSGTNTGALATGQLSVTLAGDGLSFAGEISNTSPLDARLTAFGFDLGPGNLNGFSGSPNPLAAFNFGDGDLGNVPAGFNAVDLDFGYITGPNFAGGSPNDGLAPGGTLSFTISGDFTGFTEEEIAAGIFARYQRVGENDGSDVATVTETVVPEPASMVLFGSGLLYLARRRLRRDQVV